MEIDKKLIESYTLFKRHFFLLEEHVRGQEAVLNNLAKAYENDSKNCFSEVLAIFNYVFLFVDLTVRMQKIAHIMPRINHQSAEYKEFDTSLNGLKALRNRFQHINEEITTEESDHLLGSISWQSDANIYCLTFPNISKNGHSYSVPFKVTDDKKLKFEYGFCYVLGNKEYDLNSIFNACVNLSKYLDKKITLTDESGAIDLRKKYDAWTVSLKEVDGGVTVSLA